MLFVVFRKDSKQIVKITYDVTKYDVLYKSTVTGISIEMELFEGRAFSQVTDEYDYAFFPDTVDVQIGEILTDEKLAQALPKVEAMTHEEIVQKLADLQAQIDALRQGT